MEKRKCIITLKMHVFEHHMYIYNISAKSQKHMHRLYMYQEYLAEQ